jgi:hypothetical protein
VIASGTTSWVLKKLLEEPWLKRGRRGRGWYVIHEPGPDPVAHGVTVVVKKARVVPRDHVVVPKPVLVVLIFRINANQAEKTHSGDSAHEEPH